MQTFKVLYNIIALEAPLVFGFKVWNLNKVVSLVIEIAQRNAECKLVSFSDGISFISFR